MGTNHLSRPSVTEAILKGLKTGTKDYQDVSGWPLQSNEAFLSSCLFRSISATFKNRQRDVWVTLELPKNTMKMYSGRTRGRPSLVLEGNPRFDLVIWDRENPWAVVEVKSYPGSDNKRAMDKDIERITATLNGKFKTLKHGFLAYYYQCSSEERYKRYSKDLKERNEKIYQNYTFKPDFRDLPGYDLYDGEKSFAVVAVLAVKKKS